MSNQEYDSPGVNILDRELTAKNFYTTAQDLHDNNFYRTLGGYNVFEFYAMDLSQTFSVSPSFIPAIKDSRFEDVSAIAIIEAQAINFSRLFKFKSDDTIDLDPENVDWLPQNASLNNMYFGCGESYAFSSNRIRYSNASVTVGQANKADIYENNTTIKQDYVRDLAKSITGGYAMSEIFVNEKQLIEGVEAMDQQFNASILDILYNSSSNQLASSDPRHDGLYSGEDVKSDPVALSCQNLVANLFGLNVSSINGVTNGDPDSWARGQQFLRDLSDQTTPDISDNEFYVKFRNKDVLALRLTYAPFGSVNGLDSADNGNANSAPGTNPIYSRSYKVYIVMKDEEEYANGYPVEPNPRPWVTDS